ncbi:MAG: hypothetical protein OXF94_11830 [Gammaproteobacteria bacterium]|nr:hypothetical protein [Gammaproteobacteria bacterium]
MPPPHWAVPFDCREAAALARRYAEGESYQPGVSNAEADQRIAAYMERAHRRGYLFKTDLREVARWKYRGPKLRQLLSENAAEDVRECSQVAFAAEGERLRIGALMALRGIGAPVATTILHFVFPKRYPVLDVRALRTIGAPPGYVFERWLEYAAFCRDAAPDYGGSLWKLDRSLWQYDRERKGQASVL